jgi:hypothetical protein
MIEAQVDIDAKILGQRRGAGQAKPHVAQNPFRKLKSPGVHTDLEKRGKGDMIVR